MSNTTNTIPATPIAAIAPGHYQIIASELQELDRKGSVIERTWYTRLVFVYENGHEPDVIIDTDELGLPVLHVDEDDIDQSRVAAIHGMRLTGVLERFEAYRKETGKRWECVAAERNLDRDVRGLAFLPKVPPMHEKGGVSVGKSHDAAGNYEILVHKEWGKSHPGMPKAPHFWAAEIVFQSFTDPSDQMSVVTAGLLKKPTVWEIDHPTEAAGQTKARKQLEPTLKKLMKYREKTGQRWELIRKQDIEKCLVEGKKSTMSLIPV